MNQISALTYQGGRIVTEGGRLRIQNEEGELIDISDINSDSIAQDERINLEDRSHGGLALSEDMNELRALNSTERFFLIFSFFLSLFFLMCFLNCI